MREESRAGRRHLHIIELCNGESSGPTGNSGTGENEPSPNQATSKKRRWSPEPSDTATKRRRPDTARGTKAPKSRSPGHCHPRKRHNLVEQRYRQRLNNEFKRLLDVLPTSPGNNTNHHRARPPTLPFAIDNGMDAGAVSSDKHHHDNRQHGSSHTTRETATGAAGKRRVSKGEVLDRAMLYIRALERKLQGLEAERTELELLWEEHGSRNGGRRT